MYHIDKSSIFTSTVPLFHPSCTVLKSGLADWMNGALGPGTGTVPYITSISEMIWLSEYFYIWFGVVAVS